MKRLVILILFVIGNISVLFSQGIKPKVMIIPSDAWMKANGYMITENEQGAEQINYDYARAFRDDPILDEAIRVTGGIFAERGFEFTNMSQTIKDVQSKIERNTVTGRVLSVKDELALQVSADIILYFDFNIQDVGFGQRQVDRFTMSAVDAYSNKDLGSAGQAGPRSSATAVSDLVRERVLAFINDLEGDILRVFEGYLTKGREITIEVIGSPESIDYGCFDVYGTEVEGLMLYEWFNNWAAETSINGGGYADPLEESIMINMNIPLLDEKGRPVQAINVATGLMSTPLRNIFQMRPERLGLGRAVLNIKDCK
jgi:hypothetical protein